MMFGRLLSKKKCWKKLCCREIIKRAIHHWLITKKKETKQTASLCLVRVTWPPLQGPTAHWLVVRKSSIWVAVNYSNLNGNWRTGKWIHHRKVMNVRVKSRYLLCKRWLWPQGVVVSNENVQVSPRYVGVGKQSTQSSWRWLMNVVRVGTGITRPLFIHSIPAGLEKKFSAESRSVNQVNRCQYKMSIKDGREVPISVVVRTWNQWTAISLIIHEAIRVPDKGCAIRQNVDSLQHFEGNGFYSVKG